MLLLQENVDLCLRCMRSLYLLDLKISMCFCEKCDRGNYESMPSEKECLCYLSVTEVDKKETKKVLGE